MKVLHITPSLDKKVGGPAFVARGFCGALARKSIDVTLYTTNRGVGRVLDVPLREARSYNGVPTHYYPVKGLHQYVYSPELGKALDNHCRDFDLIHIHGTWLYTTLIGSHKARKNCVPYIIRPRSNLKHYCFRKNRVVKQLYAWLIEMRNFNRAAAIHFYSTNERGEAAQLGIRSPSIIVPNGVEMITDDQIRGLRGGFISQYPWLRNKKIILFLGRIDRIKGIDRLIEAFHLVEKAEPECRLVLAGSDSGGYLREINNLIGKRGLEKKVFLTGHLTDEEKISALLDARIFCLLSYQEGDSSALKEAMLCGTAALISPEVEFFDYKEHSAVYQTGTTPEIISKSILTLLDNQSLRDETGANARKLILSKYTWDKVADQLIKEYEKILRL